MTTVARQTHPSFAMAQPSKYALEFILNAPSPNEKMLFSFPTNLPTAAAPSRGCRMPDCDRVAISRGVCIRHGGGPRCSVAGCRNGAKSRRLCWKHGGSTKCTIASCNNRSKARGLCWSHGGGKPCSQKNCSRTALSRGLCWAHGGGIRYIHILFRNFQWAQQMC
ncbi:hypothetical protein, variant, partial [Aphanomyces astaci]